MDHQKEAKKPQGESGKGGGSNIEGLPFEDSPYVQYKDLEDYKRQGYGTEGHEEIKEGRGAGSTEAPTLSGADVSNQAQAQAKDKTKPAATDAINRQGVP